MDYHKSAEELQTLRRKLTQAQMPCRSGPKDSVADGSEEQAERLKEQLDELEEVLSEERILRKGNISVGKWNDERELVEVSVAKGVHWNVFGKSIQGCLVLEAEEALYMLDHGMLELYHNDLPVSVQQAYELLLSDEFPLYHYIVYSHLRNLGFIALRHQRLTEYASKETNVEDKKTLFKQEVAGMDISCESEEVSHEMEVDERNLKEKEIDGGKKAIEESYEGKIDEDIGKMIKGKIKTCVQEDNLEHVIGISGKSIENEVDPEEKSVQSVHDLKEGKSEEVKESVVEVQVKTMEDTKNDRENKMLLDENNPVLHYWKDKECQPLVHPRDATSLENILEKLQVIKGQTRPEATQHRNAPCRFQITYDVFQPQKNFRKSDPGLPNHSICVCKFSAPPPSIGEMNFMASQSYPVPLKYAVVDGRDVSFYSVLDVQLPTYIER